MNVPARFWMRPVDSPCFHFYFRERDDGTADSLCRKRTDSLDDAHEYRADGMPKDRDACRKCKKAAKVGLRRMRVYFVYGGECAYCGKFLPPAQCTVDHIVPRVLGGSNELENLALACTKCNGRKGGRLPDESEITAILRKRVA